MGDKKPAELVAVRVYKGAADFFGRYWNAMWWVLTGSNPAMQAVPVLRVGGLFF